MREKTEGQALVLMAFALVALAAMVGLAIDGGRLYSQRRQTQNAADAAAMAGTRELAVVIAHCGEGDAAADLAVRQAIVEMARLNGVEHGTPNGHIEAQYVNADEQALGWVGAGSIPNGATGVRVTMTMTDTATFMKVVGQDTLSTAGEATGIVGEVRTLAGGAGLLPIAVPLEVVEALASEQTFYIMENDQHYGGMFCLRDDPESDEDCVGDPASYNAHRGWLNLNYIYNTLHISENDPYNRTFQTNVSNRGCGGDPTKSVDDGLKGWAGDGCPYPFPVFAGTVNGTDGDFIHGDPGARQSSLMTVVEAYNGKTAIVPIFDRIFMSDYMAEHPEYFPEPEEPPDGNLGGHKWPRAGGGGHAFLYHIVGFAAVQINDPNMHDHTLVGDFEAYTLGDYSELVPTAGVGASCELDLKSIALWH